MAVLFIIYIPLEKTDSEVENSGVDQGNGIEYVAGSEGRIKGCSDEGGSTGDQGKSFEEEVENSSATTQQTLKQPNILRRTQSKESQLLRSLSNCSHRISHSMVALDSMSELEEQIRRKINPLCDLASKEDNNSTWPRRSVTASTEQDSIYRSVGKFTVTKASNGPGVDVLRPGISDSKMRLCHFSNNIEIETEVFTLEEVKLHTCRNCLPWVTEDYRCENYAYI